MFPHDMTTPALSAASGQLQGVLVRCILASSEGVRYRVKKLNIYYIIQ